MLADFENMPYGTALRVITESIAAFHQVDAVILFGSRARGDNAPRADIDLAVSYVGRDSMLRSKIDDIIDNAPTLLPIDCVHLEEAYSDLKANILHDGKRLFKREEKPWIDMLTDRNETSQLYDENRAQLIYERIKTYYPILEETYRGLLALR